VPLFSSVASQRFSATAAVQDGLQELFSRSVSRRTAPAGCKPTRLSADGLTLTPAHTAPAEWVPAGKERRTLKTWIKTGLYIEK